METLNEQLINAIIINNTEKIKSLIENGADVNAKDDDGWAPLHYVSVSGNKDITELLIKSGADVNIKQNDGLTLLHYASISGYKKIVELLKKHGAEK